MSIITLKPNHAPITMVNYAKEAMQHAYAPYSCFKVGACIKTKSNAYFTGCNVENLVNGLSICAEATAIGNMITNNEKYITELVVMVDAKIPCPCCGSCLQRLAEFGNKGMLIHLCTVRGRYQAIQLSDAFPLQFTHRNLE